MYNCKKTPGANPIDPILNHSIINKAKEKADFILVILHGGNEYYHYPRPGLVNTCRYYVDIGANAVVCHHPHVVGGIEVYKEVPIVYSTGNFIFDSVKKRPPGWNYGYLVRIDADTGGVNSFRIIPYYQSGEKPGVISLGQSERTQILSNIAHYSAVISNEEELFNKWDEFCCDKRSSVEYDFLFPFNIRGLKRILNMFPFLINPFIKKTRVAKLLNQVRCESHRELLTSLLERKINSDE